MPPSGGVGRRARKGRRTGRFPYGLARAMHLARRVNGMTDARNQRQEAIAMRNLGRGVIVGVAFVAACGGGTKNAVTPTTRSQAPIRQSQSAASAERHTMR